MIFLESLAKPFLGLHFLSHPRGVQITSLGGEDKETP